MPIKSIRLNRAWDILIIVGATLSAISIPVRLVFGLQKHAGLLYSEWVITLVFLTDILFHFVRSRRMTNTFMQETRGSAANHLKRWFTLDLVAAIPFGALLGATPIQLFRLLKLARVAQFMRQWRQRAVQNSNILRLAFFAYWLLLSAHWIACGWIALRGISAEADNWMSYLRALYWAVQTLSTVGYGDVTPATNAQTLYTMAVMIFGVGVYGYIIGNVASILANIDPAKVHYLENMERLTAFMNYRDIPPILQKRIRDYYTYLWEKRLSYDESTVISSLPPSLRTDVSLFLKRDIIEKVPLFQGASDEFIREIALEMRPIIFTPGDYIYKAGEPGRDMYFISRGTVEVVSKDGKTVHAKLTDGDFFGEIALVLSQPRTASVRAVSYCDLYRLDKEMFERVLAHYPEIAAQLAAMARARQGMG